MSIWTTAYMIDKWTVVHFLHFFFLGIALRYAFRVTQVGFFILASLVPGLLWEVLETQIEHLWTPTGEPFLNRWCTDIIADILGGIAAWMISRKPSRDSI